MWWEYVIVWTCLAAAAIFAIWFIRKVFTGPGETCGTGCSCHHRPDAHVPSSTGLKVTPLVQVGREDEPTQG